MKKKYTPEQNKAVKELLKANENMGKPAAHRDIVISANSDMEKKLIQELKPQHDSGPNGCADTCEACKPRHTPTPWDIDGNSIRTKDEYSDCIAIVEKECGHMRLPMEANAAFIVLAVNCHEELVSALRVAQATIHATWKSLGLSAEGDVAKAFYDISKAIAKAEGK